VPQTPWPADGEFRLGSLVLAGRRVRAYEGTDEPVARVTGGLVSDSGRTWRLVSEAAAETGLQPVLCVPPRRHPEEWHPDDYFAKPYDVGEIDQLNAEDILKREWEGRAVEDGELEGTVPQWDPAELYAPFSRQFPGLAPPTPGPRLTAAEILRTLDTLPPACLCLVAARRPADILATVGWETTDAWESMAPVSAVWTSFVGGQVRGEAGGDGSWRRDPAPGGEASANAGGRAADNSRVVGHGVPYHSPCP
jgi:hypothetical protein